jgi:hypothetical protein
MNHALKLCLLTILTALAACSAPPSTIHNTSGECIASDTTPCYHSTNSVGSSLLEQPGGPICGYGGGPSNNTIWCLTVANHQNVQGSPITLAPYDGSVWQEVSLISRNLTTSGFDISQGLFMTSLRTEIGTDGTNLFLNPNGGGTLSQNTFNLYGGHIVKGDATGKPTWPFRCLGTGGNANGGPVTFGACGDGIDQQFWAENQHMAVVKGQSAGKTVYMGYTVPNPTAGNVFGTVGGDTFLSTGTGNWLPPSESFGKSYRWYGYFTSLGPESSGDNQYWIDASHNLQFFLGQQIPGLSQSFFLQQIRGINYITNAFTGAAIAGAFPIWHS